MLNNLKLARNVFLTAILLISILGQSSCSIDIGVKSINDVINAVDQARQTIEQESTGWRDELPKLVTQLNGMESNIAADTKEILSDTTSQVQDMAAQTLNLSDAKAQDLIAQAGVEFRCNAEFVKAGAISELKNIVEDLQFWKANKKHKDTKPSHNVCWINPSALSLYPSGTDWLINTNNMSNKNIVHVFGYNFWSDKLPTLELWNDAGQKIRDVLVTPAYVTHYQINLDFSNEKFSGFKSGERVVFHWQDLPEGQLDPNTISLVQSPPALLGIQNVVFNNTSPTATQDMVFPKVTIINQGGSPSDYFTVKWVPGPDFQTKSASLNRNLNPGESVELSLSAFSYPRCGTFSTNLSLSNGAASQNTTITVAPYCPAVATLVPQPEKQYKSDFTDSGTGFPGGGGDHLIKGGRCDAGYHRSRVLVTATTKGTNAVSKAGCYFEYWALPDEADCQAVIRLYYDLGTHVDCTIKIYEIGNPMPTPTPPPSCSCRP